MINLFLKYFNLKCLVNLMFEILLTHEFKTPMCKINGTPSQLWDGLRTISVRPNVDGSSSIT